MRIRKPYVVIKFNHRSRMLHRGIGLSYSRKGGGPILNNQSIWYRIRHINGFYINRSDCHYWVLFWRHGR